MTADALAPAGRPRRLATVPTAADVIDRSRAALAKRDIVPPKNIIADGNIHRCDAAGKNGKGDAAYLLHLDGIPAGGLENWRDGTGWESWHLDIGRALRPAELDGLHMTAQAASSRRMDAAARRHAAARAVAARIWHAAQQAGDDHPYLARKGVAAHGLRVVKGALVVPIRDSAGELHSLQFIGTSGTKRFLKGGRVAGMYFQIGAPGKVVCIAEGYATGSGRSPRQFAKATPTRSSSRVPMTTWARRPIRDSRTRATLLVRPLRSSRSRRMPQIVLPVPPTSTICTEPRGSKP